MAKYGMNMGRGYEWRTVCFHFVKKRKYVRGKLSEVDMKWHNVNYHNTDRSVTYFENFQI